MPFPTMPAPAPCVHCGTPTTERHTYTTADGRLTEAAHAGCIEAEAVLAEAYAGLLADIDAADAALADAMQVTAACWHDGPNFVVNGEPCCAGCLPRLVAVGLRTSDRPVRVDHRRS